MDVERKTNAALYVGIVVVILSLATLVIAFQSFDKFSDLESNTDLKLEEAEYVYLVDVDTGQRLVDSNTGYPLRLHVGNNLQGLLTVVGNQQQTLQNHKSGIELNNKRINEIVNFLNQVRGGVVESENQES